MKRKQAGSDDAEPHVFDQTNGAVDLGSTEREVPDSERERTRNETVGGIAMMSVEKP